MCVFHVADDSAYACSVALPVWAVDDLGDTRVFDGTLRGIDDEHLHWTSLRVKLKAELLLHRSEEVRRVGIQW